MNVLTSMLPPVERSETRAQADARVAQQMCAGFDHLFNTIMRGGGTVADRAAAEVGESLPTVTPPVSPEKSA